MDAPRSILHVDMDAFYASVEIREQPGLAGRPVAVGGTPQGRGVVAAANYEARKFGVHSAMPMSRAIRLCPTLICLPVNMSLYVDVSHQIRQIFERFTPQIEPLSLDEAFLDVSGSERLFGRAYDVALEIKSAIVKELRLVASIGVAPNKYLAKIASDVDKPDGLVEIQHDEIQTFLDPLPASRIWGVGKNTNAVLERYGIHTIAQVRQQPVEWLEDRFGKFGRQLWELSRGIDSRPVMSDSEAKSISNETTFSHDIKDVVILKSWMMDLTEQVARRLRAHERFGRTVQIKLRFEDFTTITRSHTLLEATQTTRDIWQAAEQLLQKALQTHPKPIRLIGVGVSNLLDAKKSAGVQTDLFRQTDNAKQDVIDQLADEVHSRFGESSLKRGSGIKH